MKFLESRLTQRLFIAVSYLVSMCPSVLAEERSSNANTQRGAGAADAARRIAVGGIAGDASDRVGTRILTGLIADCNGNSTPDDVDIAGGTSIDQNGDGIPDECPEVLLFQPEATCVTNVNDTICVDIVVSNIDQAHPILAVTVNIEWNPTDLGSCWVLDDIFPAAGWDQFGSEYTQGHISYSVTRTQGLGGQIADASIATACFISTSPQSNCCSETLYFAPGVGASATALAGNGYASTPDFGPSISIEIDAQEPMIQCGPNLVVSNDPGDCGWSPPNGAIVRPNATDNCDCELDVAFVRSDGRTGLNDHYNEGNTNVVWTAVDCCGNSAQCTQLIRVRDTEAPVILPGNGTHLQVGVNESCEYVLEDFRNNGTITITDNCSPDPQVQQTPPPGTVLSRGVHELVLNANDSRGNNTGVVYFLWVLDDMPPEILSIPTDVVMSADAGRCDALFQWSFAATDNCGAVSTTCTPNGIGKRFAIGDTQVNCRATDATGNVTSSSFIVTVDPTWQVDALVQLSGFVSEDPFDRCVDFEFLSCTAGTYDESTLVEMTFENGIASVELTIPTGSGAGPACTPLQLECAGAKEVRHSLREYVAAPNVRIVGRRFVAEWQGSDALRLGNFDGNEYVDIFDWIVWNAHFNGMTLPGVDVPSFNDCSGPPDPTTVAQRNSDATGDDRSTAADYSHLYINNAQASDEPVCCQVALQSPAGPEPTGPRSRVSVAELRGMGWNFATDFDYNGDGFVDYDDTNLAWPDDSGGDGGLDTEPASQPGSLFDQVAPPKRTERIEPGRKRQ